MTDPGRSLPPHFREKSARTDSAGTPWAGRDYAASPFPGDDGSTPPEVQAALAAHRAGQDPHRTGLVRALAGSRVLVPIMAVATELGTTAHGLTGDNGADMAMVSIQSPDGAKTLPIFTSAAALTAWRADARPVPVVTPQAAQAAVQEECTSLLVDPAGSGAADAGEAADAPETGEAQSEPILLPRSVLWALAQGRDWIPPHEDPELAAALEGIGERVAAVIGLSAHPGTRTEVELQLRLQPGLTAEQVQSVLARVTELLSTEPLVAERISSLRIALRN